MTHSVRGHSTHQKEATKAQKRNQHTDGVKGPFRACMYTFGSGCDILTSLWERGREVMSMIQAEVVGLWLGSGHWNKQVFAEDQGVLVRASIAV